ncbi:MAG: hypothetical protein ACREO4_06105 [Lysobacter sp.]
MSMPCDTITIPQAEILVNDAHGRFTELGTQTYNLAIGNLGRLAEVDLAQTHFSVSFDFEEQLAAFQRPARPNIDWNAFEFRDPGNVGAAPAFTPTALQFDSAPEFDHAPPTLTFGPRPNAPDVAVPTAPAAMIDIDVPLPPDYVLPEVPTLLQLNLPDAPDVQIPAFTAEAPVYVEPPFQEDWSFEPTAYVGRLMDELTAKLKPMIMGQEALPPAISAALFERNRSRIEIETGRAVEQAVSEFSQRGFYEPNGMLNGRVMGARQTGQNAIAEASRDVAIKEFEEALANLRFAITQGAALEGVSINLHAAEQGLLLQAATFQRESALAVLNYRITVHNAKLETYKTEAAVARDRIQAALAKVEVFRAQIEGERARGEINDQKVRVYESQLRSLQTMADFYRERINAVKVQAEINREGIERYKIEVDAYGERWRAHVAEWQGYSAGIEGEGKRADLYKSLVEASTERTRAWSLSQNMKIDAERLRMDQHGQSLDVWRAGLTRVEQLLSTERGRLAAVGQGADAQARMYVADAGVEQAASAATDRSFELGLSKERAAVDTQLKVAEMKITEARGLIDQALEMRRAQAQISSQLAASTMSAVSYGASVSSGWSQSKSCGQSFNFSGEIVDA